jgi:hypothetical protein
VIDGQLVTRQYYISKVNDFENFGAKEPETSVQTAGGPLPLQEPETSVQHAGGPLPLQEPETSVQHAGGPLPLLEPDEPLPLRGAKIGDKIMVQERLNSKQKFVQLTGLPTLLPDGKWYVVGTTKTGKSQSLSTVMTTYEPFVEKEPAARSGRPAAPFDADAPITSVEECNTLNRRIHSLCTQRWTQPKRAPQIDKELEKLRAQKKIFENSEPSLHHASFAGGVATTLGDVSKNLARVQNAINGCREVAELEIPSDLVRPTHRRRL